MDDDVREVVLATVKRVVLRAGLVNGEAGTAAIARSNGTIEFRADELDDADAACALVSHELRHAWQFGSGFVSDHFPTEVEALRFKHVLHRVALEHDADAYSEALGFPRAGSQLAAIQNAWPYLDQQQRNAFVIRANEIRLRKRAKQRSEHIG
jgi:adenylate kinase family enzyme